MTLQSFHQRNPKLELDEAVMESGDVEALRKALARAVEVGNDWRLRLANVRSHHPRCPQNSNYCNTCFEPWPCSTIRSAEGEVL